MNPRLYFWIAFILMSFVIFYCDKKYNMLKDVSTAKCKPYSFARVQLAWWSVIILACFISTLTLGHGIPTFDSSTIVLLGISAGTTATARLIDVSDAANPNISLIQNDNTQNFILDILSDGNGVSIHRFQSVVFNIVFGIWFIISQLYNLQNFVLLINKPKVDFIIELNKIIPIITQNDLILLGVSSGVYAALKVTENKTQPAVG